MQQVLPGITLDEVIDAGAVAARRRQPRGARRHPAEAERARCRPKPSCARRSRAGRQGGGHAVERDHDDAGADGNDSRQPARGRVAPRDRRLGVTVVRFANGVEAWLKPTDFKNDQVLFTMYAPGGASLAPPADFAEASLATALRRPVRRRRAEGARPAEGARRQARVGVAVHRRCRPTASPASPRRRELETALQLLYQEFTAPGDDPEAFALMKRQLDAAVANRGRSPGPGVRREASSRSTRRTTTRRSR